MDIVRVNFDKVSLSVLEKRGIFKALIDHKDLAKLNNRGRVGLFLFLCRIPRLTIEDQYVRRAVTFKYLFVEEAKLWIFLVRQDLIENCHSL